MTGPISAAIAGNGSTPPAAEVGVAPARARLAAELDWLRLVLAEEVERFRAGRHRSPEAFLGFTIDDAEVDHLLTEPVRALTRPRHERGAEVRAARVRADETARAVAAVGRTDGLRRLGSRFALDADDLTVLLLAAAPDLDDRFETLCAYLHDDIGRRRASIGLALRMLSGDLGDRWEAGRRFDRGAPLVRHGLIRIDGDGPFLSRTLAVDDRILDELVDRTGSVDTRLAGWITVTACAAAHDGWPTDVPDTTRVLLLDGRAAADAGDVLATRRGHPVLRVRLSGLVFGDQDVGGAARLLAREALLRDATVVVTDGEALLPTPGAEHRSAAVRDEFTRLLATLAAPVIVICGAGWPDGVLLDGVDAVRHTVDVEPFAARRDRWSAALSDVKVSPASAELDEVAALFALSPGQIRRAAGDVARTGTPGTLAQAARNQLAHGLGGLARRLEADVGWDDLVVSPAAGRQLRELATVARSRHLLADTHSVALRSRGLSFLFAGPSGTGKTLAASVLAAELGLDIYAIDLATVVNKYIGETEKQLRRVFSAAQSSNAILFFDEADALFGKRSEVSDAHDRYANIEVAYLLQQMEAYDGVAILATNLSGNLDDAFTRRVHQVVEFAFPDATLRARLWEVMLRGTAVSDDVEVPALAERFELAGGNIRNCAVHARLLAAAAEAPIGHSEVMVAVAREYQKLGRHPSRTEFGDSFGDILELLGGS